MGRGTRSKMSRHILNTLIVIYCILTIGKKHLLLALVTAIDHIKRAIYKRVVYLFRTRQEQKNGLGQPLSQVQTGILLRFCFIRLIWLTGCYAKHGKWQLYDRLK